MSSGRRLRRVDEPGWARRRHLAERLAAQGLPSEVGGRRSVSTAPGELGRRLTAALDSAGPIPEAFGAYLGCRPDLIAGLDCAELAALPEHASCAPPEQVVALVEHELAAPITERFALFEAEPFDSRRFAQIHGARRIDGATVWVKVVRPDAVAGLEDELGALDALEPTLAAGGVPFPEAREGFERALLRQLDLAGEGRQLTALAAGPAEGVAVAVPLPDLSRGRVLGLCAVGGDEMAPVRAEPGVARRLWALWLRLLLDGPAAPMELAAPDLRQLRDGRLLVLSTGWLAAPEDLRHHLQAWLFAAARWDPDEVAARLVPELAVPPGSGAALLAARLRQATAFREGGWGEGGEALDEQVFLHLRVARNLGFAPSPRLADVVPGLVRVASLARRLDPAADGLRQAIEERELSQRAREMSDLLRWERLGANLESHAMLLAALPERMDQLLTRAAAERPAPAVPPLASVETAAAGGSTVAVAAMVGLGALVLLAERLTAAGLEWVEAPATLLAVALGAVVLRGLLGRR